MSMSQEEIGMIATKIIGIYEILNIENGKRYIGQSIDVLSRLRTHRYLLKSSKRSKDCNRYLYNSVKRYGLDKFQFNIIEECGVKELNDRENYWIEYFKTLDRKFGYNLRTDIGGRGVTHEETRVLISKNNRGEDNPNFGNKWSEEKKKYMSDLKKKQYSEGTVKVDMCAVKKGVNRRFELWEQNPDLKNKMAEKVSDTLRKYDIARLDYNTLEVLEVYKGRLDLKKKHPDYYTQAILGCCSGNKNSYKGFKWKYVDRDII